jgi:hypothetical protein
VLQFSHDNVLNQETANQLYISNSEYHGNLGPIVGTRISVVAFLHNTLQSKEARRKAKQAKKKVSLPEYVSS